MTTVALLVANVLAQGCDTFCTFDYTPVCAGGAGSSPQTFPNACALDVHNCQHKTGECINNLY